MVSLLDVVFLLGRAPLVGALGAEQVAVVRARARAALPALVARLPDLHGRSGARTFLLATCALVAFHRALPGRSAADNAALFQAGLRHAARLVPGPARRLYRWIFFQPGYHRWLFASVVAREGARNPGDFEGVLVEGVPGRSFGVDYSGCAIQTFLREVGAGELAGEVCGLDELESEVFGLGLRRTGTIGRGARGCDFRWGR